MEPPGSPGGLRLSLNSPPRAAASRLANEGACRSKIKPEDAAASVVHVARLQAENPGD